MNATYHRIASGLRLIAAVSFLAACNTLPATAEAVRELDNPSLSRKVGVIDGRLATLSFKNKLNGKSLSPLRGEEFRLRLSESVDSAAPDLLLTSADFKVRSLEGTASEIAAELHNEANDISVTVRYTLKPTSFFGHKQLTITSGRRRVLELVDVESLPCDDGYSPYQARDMMWVNKKFLPALGQPLYTSATATFWGVEFPACWNRIEEGTIRCGYQRGVDLEPAVPYQSHRAVFGVADHPRYVRDAFLAYIDQVRASPVELRIQYNSWFDFGGSITEKRFVESLEKLHQELVVKRGCKPLDVYTIDDGWQNSRPPRSPLADWTSGLFPVNEATFGKDLATVRQAIEARSSAMGIWVSPACIFGARANIDVLENAGFETLVGGKHPKSGMVRKAMSMAGPKYTALLERRLLELVDQGAVYFKLDGFFGDVAGRVFETKAGRGAPVMSRIIPEGMLANDPQFDDPKFDETKRYYITASTERLAGIFDAMRRKNPKVRILCHNGATISPWWLMHTDVLSLVNSNDGAPGDRREQMCYRDGLYHQLVVADGSQVPLNSFFNHEPAKDGSRFDDKTIEGFKDYLFMALSRGTSTVEFYFVVSSLDAGEYDVIADGLKWLRHTAPAFKRSRMHGGNPLGSVQGAEGPLSTKKVDLDKDAQPYGYTGWTETQGYVSIHNPSSSPRKYSVVLDRDFGLIPGSGPFDVSLAVGRKPDGFSGTWRFGDTLTLELPPRSVTVMNFDRPAK